MRSASRDLDGHRQLGKKKKEKKKKQCREVFDGIELKIAKGFPCQKKRMMSARANPKNYFPCEFYWRSKIE